MILRGNADQMLAKNRLGAYLMVDREEKLMPLTSRPGQSTLELRRSERRFKRLAVRCLGTPDRENS